MKIDSHSHIFPLAYLEELKRHRIPFGLGGEEFAVFDQMYSPEKRLEDMDQYGVDMQLLSLGPPGIDLKGASAELTVRLARIANDAIAEVVARYPDKFAGLAALPMQGPEEARAELERGVKQLGMKGAKIFSNVNGQPLDAPQFWQVYAKAAELDVPLFIHPTLPVAQEGLQEYGLTIIVGLLFDSTLAICRLIFAGVLEKYPELKLILAHLGSTLPYILARLDIESSLLKQFVPSYRLPIERRPSEYFKKVYVDTVSHHRPAYLCAHATCGPGKILLGSDYPYSLWRNTVKAIEELEIPEEDKERIFSGNARSIFKL